jgi:hypothetical protein
MPIDEETPVAVAKKLPASLDLNKLGALPGPFTVRLTREVAGRPPEVIPLPRDGAGWSHEEVRGLESSIVGYSGGGTYHCQVTAGNGEALEWKFFISAKAVTPGETRVAAEAAEQRARGEVAFAQQQYGAPVNPFAAWQQPQPQWGAQPQPPPPAWPYGLPPDPRRQPMVDGWGRPISDPRLAAYFDPYGFGSPMPPMVPPAMTPSSAIPPELAARLQRLEEQNETLREEKIRREASAATDRLVQEFTEYRRATDARFEQLIEKMTGAINARGGASADDAMRAQLEAVRRDLESQRIAYESKFAQQRLEDEGKRREETLRAELQRVADQHRADVERFQRTIEESKQNGQTHLLQAALDKQAEVQRETAQRFSDVFAKAVDNKMGPTELLTLAQNFASIGKDPTMQEFMRIALDRALNGGQGSMSTGDAIAQLGSALIDAGKTVATSVVESKTAGEREKARQEAIARTRVQQAAQQAQQPLQTGTGQLNGARNGAAAHAVPAAAMPTPGTTAPMPSNVVPFPGSAEEALEAEERPYFGDMYGHVKQLRAAVKSGVTTPEQIVRLVCEAYVAFASFMVMSPLLHDLKNDPQRAVDRALPDADAAFRRKVVALLVEELPKAERAFAEDVAAEKKEAEAEAAGGGDDEGDEGDDDGTPA